MAKFDFHLVGCKQCHRVEVGVADLGELAADIENARFIAGELEPDEWGQVRRMFIRSDRIQVIVEAD